MRYDRGVIESVVDLTYRGLALGRRIKLTEVRPSTAFVELAAPMPVGTPVAIVTDDGVTLDATVTWIHEQVAGAERTPGMVIAPALVGDAATAWWQARVALPEDPAPPPRPSRSRPVTVRPRPNTERTKTATDRSPPPDHSITEEVPTVITAPPRGLDDATDDGSAIRADLQARVTAAAGLDLRPEGADAGGARDGIDERTTAARPLDLSPLTPALMRHTGEHDVVDDGNATMIMEAVDPATLGIDPPPGPDARPHMIDDEPSAPVITIEAADDGDGDAEPDGDSGDAVPSAGPSDPTGADKPAGRSTKRRRKRR